MVTQNNTMPIKDFVNDFRNLVNTFLGLKYMIKENNCYYFFSFLSLNIKIGIICKERYIGNNFIAVLMHFFRKYTSQLPE